MYDIFDTYSRMFLNFKCQNYNVSGKRGAPKTKLLSATPKYNFEMKLKENAKLYFIFSW